MLSHVEITPFNDQENIIKVPNQSTRFTYVVIDQNASHSRKAESNRHQDHPEDICRDDDRVVDTGMVEDEHIEENYDIGQLTAES